MARVVTSGTGDRGVRRGQVYWVDFRPARGSEQTGRRPALVIQNDVGNRHSPNTIVAAMTSKLGDKEYPTEVRLSDEVFGKRSVVLCGQLLTITQERLVGPPVVQLDAKTMAGVDAALGLSLGL
jgi:mRNA interferase MazF